MSTPRFTPSLMYAAATAQRDALQAAVDAASDKVRAIPGVGTGRMGLTPDAVKQTPAYREALSAYQHWFSVLRDFNGGYVRMFKREMAAERAARRAAIMATA